MNKKVERITDAIQVGYEYETAHTDAANNYSVLLGDSELEFRCHAMQFSDNRQDSECQLLHYIVLDIAYLGQSEMEIPVELEESLTSAEVDYIECKTECVLHQYGNTLLAYRSYPDISVQAVIDLETDCMATGTPEFNQELFQRILAEVPQRQWCIDTLVKRGRR